MQGLTASIRSYARAAGVAAAGLATGVRLALLERLLLDPQRHSGRIRTLLNRRGTHILVACMPKSGSTFLAQVLRNVTGFSNAPLAYGYAQNEQDLYLPALLRIAGRNTVTQQHIRATDPNIELINQFSMRPVVLVRNLPDIAASFYDYLHRHVVKGSQAYLDQRFYELDAVAQADLIVDLVMPWYINFYVSWYDADTSARCPVLWVTYEEVTRNTTAALQRIMDFCGMSRTRQQMKAAIADALQADIKMNKGVSGRGRSFLSEAQASRIVQMTRHYPWVDFSRIVDDPSRREVSASICQPRTQER